MRKKARLKPNFSEEQPVKTSYRHAKLAAAACYVCSLILCASLAAAQAPSSNQTWTLAKMVERALETSPDVHEALADELVSASQLKRAKVGRLPTAEFTGLLSPITGVNCNTETYDTFIDCDSDSNDFGIFSKGELKVIQPLYTFGRLRNEIRAAQQGLHASEAATKKAQHAVIFAVKELYYNLLLSLQSKDLLDDSQENFTKAVETVEERLDNDEGTATEQDLLRLRIGVASVTKEQLTLERAIAITRSALKRHLGLSAQDPFELADTRLAAVNVDLKPLDFYRSQASQQRPEIAQLEAGLAARQARVEAARSQYYPAIFLAAGFEYAVAPNREDPGNPLLNDFNSLSGPGAALGVRWKLDFWQTRAKVAERAAKAKLLAAKKDAALSGIALDIERRYLEVKEYQQKVDSAEQARKAARGLLVTTLANFQLGVGAGKDVFEGLGLYARIVGDYYKTLRNFNIAAAKFTQATGQEVVVADGER